MDGQKIQTKLTRTQSSLLRSSPTMRSSIHSLSSFNIAEGDVMMPADQDNSNDDDEEKQKTKKPQRSGSFSIPRSNRLGNGTSVVLLASLTCFTLFSLFFFTLFFFFLRKEEIPTSENLLLALIFIAIALFFVNKKRGLIHSTISALKQRVGFNPNTNSKPVQWFIGDPNETKSSPQKRLKTLSIREGVEFYSSGDFYEGEFHQGKCNGSGVYYYYANGRYEGDWIDGRYDGYGMESWARGSKYRGQYRQGLRHGFGVYRFYTGDSYAGEWYNGQSHGLGVQTCSDFSSYVGEFKHGVKHGLGSYLFRNGDRYAGDYFGDKVHGFGVYHFGNGHFYEGSWHEGRKQGYGMYTFRNGHTRCGEWDCGNLKHPLSPLTDPILRAVQGARNTAEKAMNLGRVDEEVNKAVMAANKAATAARVAAIRAVQNRMDGKFYDSLHL